jgi:hypothetical protein
MRIGLDIHGVLDHHPEKFIKLAYTIMGCADGYEKEDPERENFKVFVITGPKKEKAIKELEAIANKYNGGYQFWDEVYSIVDYIIENDIPHIEKESGHIWTLVHKDWNEAKGKISKELELDLHFDDSVEYEEYFEPGVFCHVKRRK